MSDRPSYTNHPQPSGVSGSGCMDFCIDRLNHQAPLDEGGAPLKFEGIEPTDYLTHQPDTTAELNINRSYDDLLDVSTPICIIFLNFSLLLGICKLVMEP